MTIEQAIKAANQKSNLVVEFEFDETKTTDRAEKLLKHISLTVVSRSNRYLQVSKSDLIAAKNMLQSNACYWEVVRTLN